MTNSGALGPVFSEEGLRLLPRPASDVLAAVLSGRTLAVEELQFLLAKLYTIGEQRPARCLGILSATAGEGKTTLAIGLAATLAAEPARRVLLVEADLRKPAIESYLGLPIAPGVAEWLRGSVATVPLRWVTPPGFALVPAGRSGLDRPDRMGSRRMAELLDAARQAFDFIIVDCPPVTPVADVVYIQDRLDGFLFLVRARQSPKEAIQRAASRLKPDRILGTIFNDQKEIFSSYYNYGYRRYGDSV